MVQGDSAVEANTGQANEVAELIALWNFLGKIVALIVVVTF